MEQDLASGLEELLSCNAMMGVLGESNERHQVGDVLRVGGNARIRP